MRDLTRYRAMRDFGRTSEPAAGAGGPTGAARRYAMQKHDASRLHWDLRLEHDGAPAELGRDARPVPRPPPTSGWRCGRRITRSTTCGTKGFIAKGNYGAGTVMLWDIGWWQPLHDVDEGLDQGHLHFALHGERATGGWSLIRMKGKKPADAKRENWLLVKENDTAARACALVETYRTSVATGRTIAQIADKARDQPMWPARRKTRPALHPAATGRTARRPPPEGEDWWHEVKLDGYRTQVALGKGGAAQSTPAAGMTGQTGSPPLLPPPEPPAGGQRADRRRDRRWRGPGTASATFSVAIKQGGPFVFYAFDLLDTGRGATCAPRPCTTAAPPAGGSA